MARGSSLESGLIGLGEDDGGQGGEEKVWMAEAG